MCIRYSFEQQCVLYSDLTERLVEVASQNENVWFFKFNNCDVMVFTKTVGVSWIF